MRIVFYNSNSNYFNPKIVHIKTMPSWAEEWEAVAYQFPEHEFFIVTMLPSMFLMDYENDSLKKARGIKYLVLEKGGAKNIADEILKIKPDVAAAASFWRTPYDWLALEDAMTADILRAHGVPVVCHSTESEAICFDKYRTRNFLEANNFNIARGIFVDYELFWCTRKKAEVRENVYREYILAEISKMNFPVIVKDTTGLSSYGMEVLPTMGAVRDYLDSKKFNSPRLVEEFLDGIQFGTEVHSFKNEIQVFPPLMYSVNQYGITSPKQSVKLGPLDSAEFKVEELKQELTRLARLLHFEGSAQIDLVFHNQKWFIIEINPRLSGSSGAIALIKGKTLPRILTEFALEKFSCAKGDSNKDSKVAMPHSTKGAGVDASETNRAANLCKEKLPLYLNIKFPNLSEPQMRALYALPFVHYLCQTDNDAAKQRREMGFCEILFGGVHSAHDLESQLDEIKARFPEIVEEGFFATAKKMIRLIEQNELIR